MLRGIVDKLKNLFRGNSTGHQVEEPDPRDNELKEVIKQLEYNTTAKITSKKANQKNSRKK